MEVGVDIEFSTGAELKAIFFAKQTPQVTIAKHTENGTPTQEHQIRKRNVKVHEKIIF